MPRNLARKVVDLQDIANSWRFLELDDPVPGLGPAVGQQLKAHEPIDEHLSAPRDIVSLRLEDHVGPVHLAYELLDDREYQGEIPDG